ncbi:alkylated DNA repair protein alkB 8 [Carex littledalei]|uniref:Alkylated DNA repair protein alkB 8 n=1 Tax=Carex littledalei TaxID=544730 RepID=A0A833VGI6_9POAL|nr:alkylated DNA repair protein alkB 8 [Carex littledalei]
MSTSDVNHTTPPQEECMCSSSVESTPEIEKNFVHRVYDAIAPHFSSTRFAKWPKVAAFLNSIKPGSIILDAGCGNGKYLGLNPDCFYIGCDISPSLIEICGKRGHEVLVADAVNLPYRNNFGDAAISIAVLHHLSTEIRRRKAIEELVRVVKKGGLVLITVWAVEQEDESLLAKWTPLFTKYDDEWVDPDPSTNPTRNQSSVHLARIPETETVLRELEDENKILNGEVSSGIGEGSNSKQQEYFVPWHLPYHRAEALHPSSLGALPSPPPSATSSSTLQRPRISSLVSTLFRVLLSSAANRCQIRSKPLPTSLKFDPRHSSPMSLIGLQSNGIQLHSDPQSINADSIVTIMPLLTVSMYVFAGSPVQLGVASRSFWTKQLRNSIEVPGRSSGTEPRYRPECGYSCGSSEKKVPGNRFNMPDMWKGETISFLSAVVQDEQWANDLGNDQVYASKEPTIHNLELYQRTISAESNLGATRRFIACNRLEQLIPQVLNSSNEFVFHGWFLGQGLVQGNWTGTEAKWVAAI